jgi:hypothetical protein
MISSREKAGLLFVEHLLLMGKPMTVKQIQSELMRRYEIYRERKTIYSDIAVITLLHNLKIKKTNTTFYWIETEEK